VRAARAAEALTLQGRTLDVAGSALRLGEGRAKRLAPYPTVGAAFVATMASGDLAHQRAVETLLDAAALPRRFVCGRLLRLSTGAGEIAGASVVVHQLSPDDSLRLQLAGLGPHRALGCGVFVPHKIISGLD
jgi:CRISPR-associated protein Cas6